MKYTTALIAIFASVVVAGAIEQRSDDNDPPKCAKKCIKEHHKISGCDKKDYKCQCLSEPFHQAVVPCIKDKCEDKKDLEDMGYWVQKTCGYVIDQGKGKGQGQGKQ